MMKKLTKILILVLSVALLVGAMVLVASAAEDEVPVWTQEKVIAVYQTEEDFKAAKADGDYSGAQLFNTLQGAFDYCKNNKYTYVALLADWENGEYVLTDAIHNAGSSLTLDLNGKTLSFSVNYKSSSSAAAYNSITLDSGCKTLTVVGNGGTFQSSYTLIQNAGNNAVVLKGGEGGLTLRSIDGYYMNEGVATPLSSAKYPGSFMFKGGNEQATSGYQSASFTVVGDVNFERANDAQRIYFNLVGNSVINIGTETEKANITCTDTLNAHNSTNVSGLIVPASYDNNLGIYKQEGMALGVTVNIVNADIDLFSEKLLATGSNIAKNTDDNDIIKVHVKNSNIYSKDYDDRDNTYASGGNNSYFAGIFYNYYYNTRMDLHIEGCTIEAAHGQYVFSGTTQNSNGTGKIALSTIRVDDSTLISKSKTGSKLPISRYLTNIVYTNSYLVTDGIASFGALWRPYDANDTDVEWPWFAKNGTTAGIGILVAEGCYFDADVITSAKASCDYKNNHGIAHTHSDKTCTATTAARGTYTGKNYYACDFTTDNDNAKAVQLYNLKTNTQKYYVMLADGDFKNSVVTSNTGIVSFNGGTVGKEYVDGTSPGFGLSWILTTTSGGVTYPRCGKFTVAANEVTGTADNKYLVHTFYANTEGKTYKTDPYINTYVTGSSTVSATAPAVFTVDDVQYYAVDVDYMTTTEYCGGAYVTFYLKSNYYNANNEAKYTSNMIRVDLSADGTWTASGGDKETYKMDYTPGVWQHFTFVLEMPTKTVEGEKVVALGNLVEDVKVHLYVDGKLANTFDHVLSDANVDKAEYHIGGSLEGEHPHTAVQDIRFGFGSVADAATAASKRNETAIDNFAITRYPAALEMSLDEVASYVTNAQVALGIEQPKDIPFATYKTESGYKTADQAFISDFIVNALFGDPYQEFELHADAKGVIDLDAIAQGYDIETFEELVETLTEDGTFSFTIKTNGYKLELSENPYIEDNDGQTLTLRTATEDEMITITFDDLDPATENKSIKVLPGKTVTADKFPAAINATYEAAYTTLVVNGWATTKYGTALTEIEIGEEDITLYPAVKAVSELSDILFNIRSNDILTFNFYIPVELVDDRTNNTIDGFELKDKIRFSYEYGTKGAASLGQTTISSDIVEIEGHKYYLKTLWPNVAYFSVETAIVIDYTVEYDGVQIDASAIYAISALDYCEYVLDNAKTYKATEVDVAANYLRYGYEYLNALAILNSNATYADRAATIKASYDKYAAAGVKFSEYEMDLLNDKGNTEAGDLTKYADLSVSINSYRVQLIITPKDDVKISKINVTTVGWAADGSLADGTPLYNEAKKISIASQNAIKLDDNKTTNDFYTKDYVFNSQNIAAHNTFGVFEVVFTLEDGSTVSGTVSLEDYYNDLIYFGYADVAEVYANVFYAIKEFGDAVVANRFEKR